jgi:hypothetical protein
MIPGLLLHRLAVRICSAKSVERIIEPTIADLQRECARLSANYLAVLWVISICTLEVREAMDEERSNIRRMLFWACLLTGVVTILLTLPPLSLYPELRGWRAFLTVVPQALPLAIPFGVVFAAFREYACAIESNASPGTVMLSKGPTEMTFGELSRQVNIAEAAGQQQQARLYSWMFHLRFTLAAAAIVISGLMVAVPVSRRLFRGLLAVTACAAYWALIFAGEFGVRRDYLMPFLGAWLPNIAFIAVALFMSSRSRSLHPARQG